MDEIILTRYNIEDIIKIPNNYKGYNIIINCSDIKNGRNLFMVKVETLLRTYRHYPFNLIINSPYKASKSIRGLLKEYYALDHFKSITLGYREDK
jgi:hypothetical protein